MRPLPVAGRARRAADGGPILRPRLIAALERSRLGVVEAGGGYGKSLLAAQYGRELGTPTVVAALPEAADANAILAALRRALNAAHLSDLAAALEAGTLAPAARIDVLVESLATSDDPVLIVLDDVHRVSDGEAAELLLGLSRSVPAPHRVLIAGRTLAAPLDELRTVPDVALLDTAELAFTSQETASLLARHRIGLPDDLVHALWRATAGWAAALRIAISTLVRAADGSDTVRRLLEPGAGPAALLGELLSELSQADRSALNQLAHLPHISAAIADRLAGPGTLARLAAAGVPIARTADGWWEMPGPVVEVLTADRTLEAATARAAADAYRAAGDHGTALRTLMTAGAASDAAALLDAMPPQVVEDLGCGEIAAVVAELPEDAIDAHPRVLLQLARVAEATYHAGVRSEAIERLSRREAELPEAIRHELDAERARDLLWDGETRAQAQALAAAVLDVARPEEEVARARALDLLGRSYCWITAEGPRERGQPLLAESARIARRIGARTWAAQALVPLAWGVHFALGQYEPALATLDEALAHLPARSRYRAVVESFRADVLTELGRPLEAQASIEEMRRLGRAFGQPWALAFAAWAEARAASYAADTERTLQAVVEAEQHRDEWYEGAGGVEFLAHAADLLDRVGHHELARQYLTRARERAGGYDRPVQLWTASTTARSGDPELGQQLIAAMLARRDIEPQERWWLELLRAHAARRAGDPAAADLAARAFDCCLDLGYPSAAIVREPAVSEQLLGPAAAAGSRSAALLLAGAGSMTVTLLGGFELRRGGALVPLPPGHPAQAVRIVAAHSGRIHADALVELLWPDTDPAAGRNRLRNLLSRLRASAGPVLVRDGSHLALPAGTAIDAVEFERAAAEALALHGADERARAVALARAALGRYRGELLPEDRYADWATDPRERLRALLLELLDLAAEEAKRREEVDEAVRLLQRAVAAEPLDEARYLELSRLLALQGRRGSALATLQRARAALAHAGLPVSPAVEALERSLRASNAG